MKTNRLDRMWSVLPFIAGGIIWVLAAVRLDFPLTTLVWVAVMLIGIAFSVSMLLQWGFGHIDSRVMIGGAVTGAMLSLHAAINFLELQSDAVSTELRVASAAVFLVAVVFWLRALRRRAKPQQA